jgi:hypothetical protein
MINPDKRVLQALVSLRGDARFETVLGWLNACQEDEAATCMTAEPDLAVRRAQGAVRSLAFILETCEKAPDTLAKLANRREHP